MRQHVVQWLETYLPYEVAATLAPSWFTCVGLAGLVTLLVMMAIARRRGRPEDAGADRLGGDPGEGVASLRRRGAEPYAIASCVLWCYVAAVSAGIVVPMTIDALERLLSTGQLRFRWAGMTSFWGYLAGGVAVWLVCRRHGLSLRKMGDMSAAPLGLALCFARLGCFLGGCDYGKVTSAPWAMRFPRGSPAWHDHVNAGLVPAGRGESLPVHPTQLYEALLGLGIAVVVLVLAREGARSRAAQWMKARDGRAFLLAAALYAVVRIGIEGLRGDAGRGIHGGLSSGQIFSIVVLVAIAASALLSRIRARRLAPALAAAAVFAFVVGSFGDAQASPTATPAAPARSPASPSRPPAAGTSRPVAQVVPNDAAPPPAPAPAPAVAPASVPAVAPATASSAMPPSARGHLAVGLLYGVAVPINRRPEQVATLGGPSLSLGYTFGTAGVWLDLDSLGNADASHGTVLVSGSIVTRAGRNLSVGGRAGFGTTLVNFDEPAFRDVMGPVLRAEAIIDLQIADTWLLWVRPLSFDLLTAADLGGPITTWQMRVGVAYKLGGARRTPAPRRAQPVAPAPPQPYPPQPPAPPDPAQPPAQPYPPQPQPQPQPQALPPPGTERGVCRPDNTCDPGLTCASRRCVVLPGGNP